MSKYVYVGKVISRYFSTQYRKYAAKYLFFFYIMFPSFYTDSVTKNSLKKTDKINFSIENY